MTDTHDPFERAVSLASQKRELEQSVLAERERCAKIAENFDYGPNASRMTRIEFLLCSSIAAAIRKAK